MNLSLKLHINANPSSFNPERTTTCLRHPILCASPSSPSRNITLPRQNLKSPAQPIDISDKPLVLESKNPSKQEGSSNGYPRFLLMGAVSVGLAVLLMGVDVEKASAFGPEGPLVEEFWDNVRRYALYALTVSTGALYTIFLPIFELLKNPISAILILIIIGGSIYVVSQVLSAMVGFTDFAYDYGY